MRLTASDSATTNHCFCQQRTEEPSLANHKSALKRHRQSLVRKARNRAMKTRVKNAVKAVRLAVAESDAAAAETALKSATAVMDKAAGKKILHWRTASRKISRLQVAVNDLKSA